MALAKALLKTNFQDDLAVLQQIWNDNIIKTDACWLWQGSIDVHGYGDVRIYEGKNPRLRIKSHRLTYMLSIADIPEGMHVLHRCDNPPCCRPDHLFLGNQAVNTADMVAKGRQAVGARHGHAKLTESQIIEIRSSYVVGQYEQFALQYNVSPSTILDIIGGRSWKYLL